MPNRPPSWAMWAAIITTCVAGWAALVLALVDLITRG
jgi:cytosine/uracil/thiamine/allantoin permease